MAGKKSFPRKIKEGSIELTHAAIKVQLSLIPGGEVLKQIIYDIPQGKKIERLGMMLDELRNQIALFEISVDENYVKSDDFFDLANRAIHRAVDTGRKEKIRGFAKLLTMCLSSRASSEDLHANSFLRYLDELTETHFQALVFIQANQIDLVNVGTYEKLYEYFRGKLEWGLDKHEFKLIIEDLKRSQLISDGGGLDDFDKQSEYFLTEASKEATVFLTSLGEKFVSVIMEVESS